MRRPLRLWLRHEYLNLFLRLLGHPREFYGYAVYSTVCMALYMANNKMEMGGYKKEHYMNNGEILAYFDFGPIVPYKKVEGIRYNIHKRSLPVGINKPVLFGLSEDDANKWISHNHTKILPDGVIIYYEKVLADSEKHDVYEN